MIDFFNAIDDLAISSVEIEQKGDKFTPLKVSLQLETPIAFTEYIYFDGLLAYCAARDLLGEDFYETRGEPTNASWVEIPLPIQQRGTRYQYNACSVACFELAGTEQIYRRRRRWDEQYDWLVDFGGKRPRIMQIGFGYKSRNMPVIYRHIPELFFYVVGDMTEIERLLQTYLRYVGKDTSHGYGKIKDIRVKKAEEDYSCVMDGRLMRQVPTEELPESIDKTMTDYQYMTYKPPYWDGTKSAVCAIPRRREN